MTNIVMICRDRYKLTKQALESLDAHTDRGAYTITIVDDGSMAFRVRGLLARFCEDHPGQAQLITLNTSDHVLARAKNIGVSWARESFGEGDWLYLSDSDVWFAPGWLKALEGFALATERQGLRLWGGQCHPFHQPERELVHGYEVAVLDGPSWLMRWNNWTGLSRDCASGPCQSEEYPFCKAIRDDGDRIGVIHPHVVVHTGLTQTDGKDAPGRAERQAMIPQGVLAE